MSVNLHSIKDAELRIKGSMTSMLNSTLVAYLILLIILVAILMVAPVR